jgi:hypothetical protein
MEKTMDCVVAKLLQLGLPLTQKRYLTFAYFGEKQSIEELEGEELAGLPEGFEDWPRDESEIN